jgi:hypothetical protein
MSTPSTANPWPAVSWNHHDLTDTAAAVRFLNPAVVHDTDDSCASYIRSVAERSLYRDGLDGTHWLCSTGGWCVVFHKHGDTWNAHPHVTPFTAARYARHAHAAPSPAESVTLNASAVCLALTDYGAELQRLAARYPAVYEDTANATLTQLTAALHLLAGNIDTVTLSATACKLHV